MKTAILIYASLFLAGGEGEPLPKAAFGKYQGERASYSVVQNDVELLIERHDVFLLLADEKITYVNGDLRLDGSYETFKQPKGEYLVKVHFNNGKSLSYVMEFVWRKKNNTIFLPGTNGEPDVLLDLLTATGL